MERPAQHRVRQGNLTPAASACGPAAESPAPPHHPPQTAPLGRCPPPAWRAPPRLPARPAPRPLPHRLPRPRRVTPAAVAAGPAGRSVKRPAPRAVLPAMAPGPSPKRSNQPARARVDPPPLLRLPAEARQMADLPAVPAESSGVWLVAVPIEHLLGPATAARAETWASPPNGNCPG